MAGCPPSQPRQQFMGTTAAAYAGANSCRMGAMQANHLYTTGDPQLIQEQLINMPGNPNFPQPGKTASSLP